MQLPYSTHKSTILDPNKGIKWGNPIKMGANKIIKMRNAACFSGSSIVFKLANSSILLMPLAAIFSRISSAKTRGSLSASGRLTPRFFKTSFPSCKTSGRIFSAIENISFFSKIFTRSSTLLARSNAMSESSFARAKFVLK